MSRFSSLSGLFPSRSPEVISDSDYVLGAFAEAGFQVTPLQSVCLGHVPTPDEAIIVSTAAELLPERGVFEDLFGNAAVLDIPLVSFAADARSIDYLIQTLAQIDFQFACTRSLSTIDLIEHAEAPLTVVSGRSELVIELGDDVSIALPKLEPRIRPGEWVSIAQFLEVGLVPNSEYTSFSVTGKLECDGCAVAHHRMHYREAGSRALAAWSELSRIRASGGFPIFISVESSRVTKIETSLGEDVLERLRPLTDSTFHGRLIEVSFASLLPNLRVDWSINSQLNEASGGFHLALGTGVNAAHIDFISSGAALRPSLADEGTTS